MIQNANYDGWVIWIHDVQHSDLWEPNIFMDHNVQNITSPIRYEAGRIMWRRHFEITISKQI
jgi:hypothetical protein